MCEAAVLSASKVVSSESPLNTTSVWSTKAVGFFNLVRVEIIKILVKKEHRPQAKQSPLSKLYLSFEISITFPWWCLGNRTLLQMLLRKQYFPIFWFIFLLHPLKQTLLSVLWLLKFPISQKVLLDKAGNKCFVLHIKGNWTSGLQYLCAWDLPHKH